MSNGTEIENMELVSSKKFIRYWWLMITSIFLAILITPFFILSLSSLIGVTSALIIDYKSVIDRDNIILIWDIATYILICFITILNLHICLYTLFGREEIYIDEEKLTVRKHCGLNYNEDETRNLIVKIYEKRGYENERQNTIFP